MENKWIDVNERLPEDRQEVLFVREYNFIEKGIFLKIYSSFGCTQISNVFAVSESRIYVTKKNHSVSRVTHWMPLPPHQPSGANPQ